jgi:DUF3015 family protein
MRIAIALALVLAAATAAAVDKQTERAIRGTGVYGSAGCGLGSMAFGNQPGGVQILASTTNGVISWNQTFGITFGTSNCGPSLFAQGTLNFVEANRQVVAKDISRGQGETIAALTVINACKDSHAVGAALQQNFAVIFPSEKATNESVTRAILTTLSDPALGCGRG